MQEWIIRCLKCNTKSVVQTGSFYGTGKKCRKCGTVMHPPTIREKRTCERIA